MNLYLKRIIIFILLGGFYKVSPAQINLGNLERSFNLRSNKVLSDSVFSVFISEWKQQTKLLHEEQMKYVIKDDYEKNTIQLLNQVFEKEIRAYNDSAKIVLVEDSISVITSPDSASYKIPSGALNFWNEKHLLVTRGIDSTFLYFIQNHTNKTTDNIDLRLAFLKNHRIVIHSNPDPESEHYMWTALLLKKEKAYRNTNNWLVASIPFIAYAVELNRQKSISVYVYTKCCLIPYSYIYKDKRWQLTDKIKK